ncbi:MAG TPA: S8 family serine peptidase [Myxococcota bacterium]|jgi:hypothetical protein|nr:S8 family serine peptidase [Myxococcota bacterium]
MLSLSLFSKRAPVLWAVGLSTALALAGCDGGMGGGGHIRGTRLPGDDGVGGKASADPHRIAGSGTGLSALPMRDGEVLVTFAMDVTLDDAGAPPADFLSSYALAVRRCSDALQSCALTFDASTRSILDVLVALRADPRVAHAGPAYLAEAASAAPADLSALQWNLYALDVDNVTTPADGDLPETIVALLDTGVSSVPGLAGVPIVAPHNFVTTDPAMESDASDDHFHGTHLAGVITDAAAGGTAGVSPGLALMPVKVLDAFASGTELDLADGIVWAVDHGATVINMSLAFPPGFYPSKALQNAVAYAAKEGVIMVAAAGNAGLDMVQYPAAFRPVIAVGASKVDPASVPTGGGDWAAFLGVDDLGLASYSNHGGMLDIVAPGGVLNEDLNGDGVVDGILAQTIVPGDPSSYGFYILAGTSHASAHMSSLVARMLANHPGLTTDEVRRWLSDGAEHYGHDVFDTTVGFGYADGAASLDLAATRNHVPRVRDYYAGVMVTLHDATGGGLEAHATIQVLKSDMRKAGHAVVIGSWIGAATGTVVGTTDHTGLVNFTSPLLIPGGCAAGFQVEAIITAGGNRAVHPRGFLAIDLDSLNLLQANASLIGGTPTIVAFPNLFIPGIRSTVTLVNFGPDLTTPPTAVAIEAACFASNFPTDSSNVLNVASGELIGGTPTIFDPAFSFPASPLALPLPITPGVGLRIVTFDPALGANPLRVDMELVGSATSALRSNVQTALDRWWRYYNDGGDVPTKPPGSNLSDTQWNDLGNLVGGYVGFLAGDQDESVDNMADVVGVTAVALPTGSTATSAYVGAVPLP